MENLLTVKTENLNLGLMKKMTAERMAELFHTENADYENPRALADLVAENRDAIQQDPEKLAAIMEATGEGLEDALDEMDNYIFYPGTDAEGYAEEMAEESGDVPEWLAYYVDYEKMGRDMVLNGDIDEVGGGVLARC